MSITVASENTEGLFGLLLGRILHHVDPPQTLAVARIEKRIGGFVAEPMAPGALSQVVPIDLDPLHLAQLYKAIPADEEGKERGNRRDCAESPVGLLDKVLQIHAVETGQECAHCETKSAHAELEIQKH